MELQIYIVITQTLHSIDLIRKHCNTAVPYDQRGADFSKATLYSLQPVISEFKGLLKMLVN